MEIRNKKGHHKIAIVGTGSIFPGAIDSKDFWLNILAEKDFIKDVPATHWLKEDYFDKNDKTGDKVYCKKGAFLDDISFDPIEFGMPPNLLNTTDTVQLLALIAARDTLADTLSYQSGKVDPKKISVILGVAGGTELIGQMSARIRRPEWIAAMRKQGLQESQIHAICDDIAGSYTEWNENTFPGLLGNVVSGRIANRFDLKGTNCVIDAACASSLGAIKMAVQELQLGTTDMVLSGGADALNDIFMYMCFSKTTALSPSEDCRPFSASGDGTVLGEGVAILALKRLEDAENDGDRIYAVISAIGSSSDGKSKSIYAPDSNGQCLAVRRAYEDAGFEINEIELIEGHGTGTIAGDYAEFNGLRLAYGEVDTNQYCALGSIKSQIGHTKSAAGAASVLKTALALNNAVLPPTIKVDKPNPNLEIESSPFYLNTTARPWIHTATSTRKAGVSSMGFGGTNFHIAMEEYSDKGRQPKKIYREQREVFLFSAENKVTLSAQLTTLFEDFKIADFAKVAKSTQLSFKANNNFRLSISGNTIVEINKWIAFIQPKLLTTEQTFEVKNHVYYSELEPVEKIAFLFPGQGSQYINMGSDLLMQYNTALEPWNLVSGIRLDDTRKLNNVVFPIPVFNEVDAKVQKDLLIDTRWAQPAIGTLALSHLGLLNKLGVKPSMVGGHSYGEIPALYASGVISSQEDMVKISRKRGELMAECSAEAGAMTAVFASAEIVIAILEKFKSKVVVANLNSPGQTVISGKAEEVEQIEIKFAEEFLKFKRLAVSTAFHSELVAPSAAEFEKYLKQFKFNASKISVYSNTTAKKYSEKKEDVPKILAKQLAAPVLFDAQVKAMYAEGARLFLEVGPGKVLSHFIKDILPNQHHISIVVDGGPKQNSKDAFFNALAQLSVAGVPVSFEALWNEVDIPAETSIIRKPSVASVKINGSNYQKLYPPVGGYASLPKPNPEVIATKSVTTEGPSNSLSEVVPRLEDPAQKVPVPASKIPANKFNNDTPADSQYHTKQAKEVKKMNGSNSQWLYVFSEIQKNIVTAQKAFQDTLAQNHKLFLETSQVAFEQLGRIAGNDVNDVNMVQHKAKAFIANHSEEAAINKAIGSPAAAPVDNETVAKKVILSEMSAAVYTNGTPKPVLLSIPLPVPVASSAPAIDLKDAILSIVSEKTGYPKEILDLDTDLESGLGIDSIKRVEILSAIQEVFPSLKNVETAKLAAMNTLGEILAYSKSEESPALPAAPVAILAQAISQSLNFEDVMLQIVSDKTGYPKEILNLTMDLESGLGIDSIKRVEILSALQEKFPVLKTVDTARLAAMNTLGEILQYSRGSHSVEIKPERDVTVVTIDSISDDFEDSMLQIVSEKTGYPKEILDLSMDLESGLGIDSIKRVEILSALQEKFPVLKNADTAKLAAMNTLAEILDFAARADVVLISGNNNPEKKKYELKQTIFRQVVRKADIKDEGFALTNWRLANPLFILADDIGVAKPLAKLFSETGITVKIVKDLPSYATHAIYLKGLNDLSKAKPEDIMSLNADAFRSARILGKNIFNKPGSFILVFDNGLETGANNLVWGSGLSALAKTAKIEWANADVQSINIYSSKKKPVEIAEALYKAITAGGVVTEMEIDSNGKRIQFATAIEEVKDHSKSLKDGDVLVVSGGAKGVTTACLIALSKRIRLNIGILGRTPLIDEPAYLSDASTDTQLKKAIVEHYTFEGKKVTPIELNALVYQILGQREINRNIKVLKQNGASVIYLSVDVCNKLEVIAAVSNIRIQFGEISGIVHAAGVLADKLIHEKTDEQFAKVFNTKITGFINLLEATSKDRLTHICCFSSVAARMGNTGQCDYAMANEVLNKVCQSEQLKRKTTCVVKSINWGPWDGGMVSAQLKNHFETMGVALIPLDEGARIFADEMEDADTNSTEVVVSGILVNWGSSRAENQQKHSIWIHESNHPFLKSHIIQTKVVVPLMMASEWCMRLAKSIFPDLKIVEVNNMKVYKGILLQNYDTTGDILHLNYTIKQSDSGNELEIKIVNDVKVLFYEATVKLSNSYSSAAPVIALQNLKNWDWSKEEIYKTVLFHDEDFHVIDAVEGISEQGCKARLKITNKDLIKNDVGLAGVLMMDGGLQLASLAMAKWTGNNSSLPLGYQSLKLFTNKEMDSEIMCELNLKKRGAMDSEWDVTLIDMNNQVQAEIRGLRMYMYRAN